MTAVDRRLVAGAADLAGPTPALFAVPDGERLTGAERAAAEESAWLIAALGDFFHDGTGLACVAGIDAAEAIRRLAATPARQEDVDELPAGPRAHGVDENPEIIGVASVPGGCVVTQPWGYAPRMPGVLTRLPAGTVCYGLYANP